VGRLFSFDDPRLAINPTEVAEQMALVRPSIAYLSWRPTKTKPIYA
jgi:hypothetical protein